MTKDECSGYPDGNDIGEEHVGLNIGHLVSRRGFCGGLTAALSLPFLPSVSVAEAGLPPHTAPVHIADADCNDGCKRYPFLVIQQSKTDSGKRPGDHGQYCAQGSDSPNVWIETFVQDGSEGQRVVKPLEGDDYQIVVNVSNLGSAPSFALCADFMLWVSTQGTKDIYDHKSLVRNAVVMDHSSVTIRSGKWSAGKFGKFPGNIIVRVFDPIADHYTENGWLLRVPFDRHLAHLRFPTPQSTDDVPCT